MLAALGREELPTEAEHVRSYVGALVIVEALRDLRTIRMLLTKAG